jgi:hypothetical protein
MKKMLVASLFMLATMAWAAAQQPGSIPEQSGGQATSPSAQTPGASQQQPSTPGSAGQDAGQAGAQGQAANAPITEGCLGGSNPNFTVTDKAGTTYKLNLPPNADASTLAPHVGESVQVMGEVKGAGTPDKASIDVSRVGRGTGKCPAGSSGGAQPPPKP